MIVGPQRIDERPCEVARLIAVKVVDVVDAHRGAVELDSRAIEAVNRYLSSSDNHDSELEGLRFGLVQCNHDGSVDSIVKLARYLVDQVQVPAIVGPASSSAASNAFRNLNIGPEGEELRRVLFISPSATSVALRRTWRP